VKTHFGPEETIPRTYIDRKKNSIVIVKDELENQMTEKMRKDKLRRDVAQLEEDRAQKINQMVIQQDKEISQAHETHLKLLLKDAWQEQMKLKKATD
jgi:hypothetical protein